MFIAKSRIIIFSLIILVSAAIFYFKSDLLSFYNNFAKDLVKFQETEIGSIIKEIGKEVFNPPPLKVGGARKNVVLVKSNIISETNLQREVDGLDPLSENEILSAAAKAKADDMFKNQYFEHVSPSGVEPASLVKSFGYDYIVTGENLILGNFASEKELVQSWMDSPGHRANILNNRYKEIGVAVVAGKFNGESVWIAVQEFGLPLSECSQPSPSLKVQIEFLKDQLDSLSLQIEEKRREIENTNPRSKNYNMLVEEHNQLVDQYKKLAEETQQLILQYNNQVNIFNQCVYGK